MKSFLKENFFYFLTVEIILVSFLISYLVISFSGVLFVDETLHFKEIVRYAGFDFRQNPYLLMLPGYHLTVGMAAFLLRVRTVAMLRLISLVFNIFAVIIFWLIAVFIDRKSALVKTVQFAFLPVLFPYLTLLYTDGFSVLTVLAALFFTLKKKPIPAGLIASFSVIVRQNNIFILVFLNLLLYRLYYRGKVTKKKIRGHFFRSLSYSLGFIILGILAFFYPQSLTRNSPETSSRFTLSLLGNIYFLLFLVTFLFLPAIISKRKKIIKFIFREYRRVLAAGLPAAILVWTFIPDHPYNRADWFLHNRIIIFLTAGFTGKALFAAGVILGGIYLFSVKPVRKEHAFFYPFAFLYLLPYWLVEWRYYIIPLTFFILFRKKESGGAEYATAIIYILISFFLLGGIIRGLFFP